MTRPPVEVRRAVGEDLDDLLMLWSQAREEVARAGRTPAGLPLALLRPRLQETLLSPDIHVLVARWDGRPAGYTVLRVAPVLAVLDASALHVDHLFVSPDARRHGVARALLTAATAIAERHGAEQVLAAAPPSARDAHRFLARLGFSPMVVRRAVSTSALRRRLAGEGERRGLEDLLSRRRSLRARAQRTDWSVGFAPVSTAPDDHRPEQEQRPEERHPEEQHPEEQHPQEQRVEQRRIDERPAAAMEPVEVVFDLDALESGHRAAALAPDVVTTGARRRRAQTRI